MLTCSHYIDGVLIGSDTEFVTCEPWTGARFARVAQAGPAEIDAAVSACVRASRIWRRTPLGDRIAAVADMLAFMQRPQFIEHAAQVISKETGKPAGLAREEVVESLDFIAAYLREARSVSEVCDLGEVGARHSALLRSQPVGVCAVIKPWNFPLQMIVWSVFPALLSGGGCIIKPSEHAPASAAVLIDVLKASDLPAGLVNILNGPGEVGAALAGHPAVSFVSLTGSVRAGRAVAELCARQLKPCQLELGGSDPALVLPDADLPETARSIAAAAFAHAGQVCTSIKRIIVDHDVRDAFVEQLRSAVTRLERGVDYGPMINRKQFEAAGRFLDDALASECEILAGARPSGDDLFFDPVLLSEGNGSAALLHDECFGPVRPILEATSTDAMVEAANATPYGLGASIWTRDTELAIRLSERIEASLVWVNDHNIAHPALPWTGRKSSGFGPPLGGNALAASQMHQSVMIRRS